MKTLILLRGLPGAGKSTYAKTIGSIILEADQYFVDPKTQEYKFDASKIKDAHADCQRKCEEWMKCGYQIVVSNTFTTDKELQPYFELAEQYGYRVYSLIVENRHNGINEHGVPEDKLEQMRNRFQIKL